jgi:hypothetical protein
LLPNGKVLVAGGSTGATKLNSAELYDPAAGAWTVIANLNTARGTHTATLLANGKVLVAGGFGSGGALNSAELYDPAAGTWTATANLNTARGGHKAALLTNGKVLVAGGADLVSTELYDIGLGSAPNAQPVITTATSPLPLAITRLALGGTRFQGVSGASSDNTPGSSTNYPLVQLRSCPTRPAIGRTPPSPQRQSTTSP